MFGVVWEMKNSLKDMEKLWGDFNSIENHRYKSWEHCYHYFRSIYSKEEKLTSDESNLAQLHLAFYLASWGMYRGSSFILQKDYTIFKEVTNEILKKKYLLLWNVKENISKKDKMAILFNELYQNLQDILLKVKKSLIRHTDLSKEKRFINNGQIISPTLITKIILGTMGCIPAYDRYLIKGLKIENLQQKFNSTKSFSSMVNYYLDNEIEINSLMKKFHGYPLMKILDMYFWSIGYKN